MARSTGWVPRFHHFIESCADTCLGVVSDPLETRSPVPQPQQRPLLLAIPSSSVRLVHQNYFRGHQHAMGLVDLNESDDGESTTPEIDVE